MENKISIYNKWSVANSSIGNDCELVSGVIGVVATKATNLQDIVTREPSFHLSCGTLLILGTTYKRSHVPFNNFANYNYLKLLKSSAFSGK
jgi:hypothetical protein